MTKYSFKQHEDESFRAYFDKLFEFENELSLIKKKNQLREDLSLLRELIESSNQSEAMDMIDEMINKI